MVYPNDLLFLRTVPYTNTGSCIDKQITRQSRIGFSNEVSVEHISCSKAPRATSQLDIDIRKRTGGATINVCSYPCNTLCNPGTGGPVPEDCGVIADALLYMSDNSEEYFDVEGPVSTYLHLRPKDSNPGAHPSFQAK